MFMPNIISAELNNTHGERVYGDYELWIIRVAMATDAHYTTIQLRSQIREN
jgi:hypothetical protein